MENGQLCNFMLSNTGAMKAVKTYTYFITFTLSAKMRF